jgi:putative MATE family efflux protein
MSNIKLQAAALALPKRLLGRVDREGYGRVLTLALPAVGEQLLNMTVGLVDTFLVGHLGAESVAAVGLANQAVLLATVFFAAVATGITALIARHIGAKEPDQARTILHQGYLLGVVLGAFTMVLGLSLAEPAMHVLQAPAEVVPLGATYLRIVSFTFVLAAWMFVGNAALRGSGDTRTPMLVMLAVNVVNIAVASVAIYGLGPIPALGVSGSALGAAAGRGVGGLIVTWALWRGRGVLRLRWSKLVLDLYQLKRILNVGLPAGGEQLLMRLGFMSFTATVAALGTKAYAAHQLALQSESIAYMPGFGFAVAATTLIGQGLGARAPERAAADARRAQRLAILTMCCMGVVFFVFAAPILGLFIEDPEVIQLGIWPLRLVAFSQPMLATSMVLSGALRGAGDTRSTLVITSSGLWLVRVPIALLLTQSLGLIGAWIAMGVDLNLRGLACWLRFRSGKWTQVQV